MIQSPQKPSPSKRKKLTFRLAAVALGLAPLVILELSLIALNLGNPNLHTDPFVGFSASQPLFALNTEKDFYWTAPARRDYFYPDFFAVQKPPNEFRVFVLGGSTVQGRPYTIETAFSTWLEMSLRAADPDRPVRVVNCGGVSYASYRLVPILQEILNYQPDLIILYTGHNEFLEDRTYPNLKNLSAITTASMQVSRLRTLTLLRQFLNPADTPTDNPIADTPTTHLLHEDTNAILDYQGGLDKYHRDPDWRQAVITHFAFNLNRMIQLTQQANIPLILANPGSNLRDSPPFKSQHKDNLTDQQIANFTALRQQAATLYKTDPHQVINLLNQAAAIDDQHAGLQYQIAKRYDALGMFQNAYKSYLRAKELDVCPLRILEPMNQSIYQIANLHNTPLVDIRKILHAQSKEGIPGADLYLDHVHPSISAHRIIAESFAQQIFNMDLYTPRPGWPQRRDQAYTQHMTNLSPVYYTRGATRLQNLIGWAQGRAIKQLANDPANPNTPSNTPNENVPLTDPQ